MLLHNNPHSPEEFFERIFWRHKDLALPANKLYQKIKTGNLNIHSRKETLNELNISQMQYYNILSTLIAIGIVARQYDDYKPSGEFVTRLKRLIEYAEV